jgi:putative Ca2+/H+ antiporter (TMEM165/GDT1 family)
VERDQLRDHLVEAPVAAALTAFLVSTAVVAVAEIGDKTMLLALVLAARFRAPFAIAAGILCATLANHDAAGAAGMWVGALLGDRWQRWLIGASFLAIAGWALIPDTLDSGDAPAVDARGAFLSTLVAFFLVEIGDKTQIATVMLAARYPGELAAVVIGTTLGLMLANAPVVVAGERLAARLPLRPIRWAAAATFAALGIAALAGSGG